MALPATDNFNGGIKDEQLTDYSASWTLNNGDFAIGEAGADSLYPDAAGTENGAHWNDDAFNANQYSQCDIVADVNGLYMGPAVRCDTGGDDYWYGVYTDDNDSPMYKMINGAWTELDNGGNLGAPTFNLELQISGVDPGTLIVFVDDVEEVGFTADDSDIDSGSAGVCGYSGGDSMRIDNWEGGNLGAPPGRTTYNTDPQMHGIYTGISQRVNVPMP